MPYKMLLSAVVAGAIACSVPQDSGHQGSGWEVYGGNKNNNRYVTMTQVDSSNVSSLQVLWQYHCGDADSNTQIQVNPVVIDSLLIGVSPKLKLFALDALTGAEKWVFDPQADTVGGQVPAIFSVNVSRGVAVYRNGDDKRIFYSAGSKLYCINAVTGKPVRAFGDMGSLDLHNGLGRDVSQLYVVGTTPGVVYKDLLIVGTRVAEQSAAAPGHIRAFDVRTGKLRWIFHTIPQPGEPGFDSWSDTSAYKHVGGANSWAGFSLDEDNGIVYAPTGSAVYDFYGGKRLGNNLYANSILALDAATGKKRWHYQTVHHDVWDRDLPTAPVLMTLNISKQSVPALAQISKTGFVFLLNRLTGEPIYPIPETTVSTNDLLPGEQLSPTQPMPNFPEPFVRQHMTAADLNTLVADSSQQRIKSKFAAIRSATLFEPPSKQGTLIFPGFDGGGEWGGPAYDPESATLFVNANEMPWILTMVDSKEESGKPETMATAGKRLYQGQCMTCHGPERKGSGNYPSLLAVSKKYNDSSLHQLLQTGRRMMPSFRHLNDNESKAIASFILGQEKEGSKAFVPQKKDSDPYFKLPYVSTGYEKFVTPEGYPAVSPPWGTLNAIDLNTGKIKWKVPLGEHAELKAKGVPATGTENYGGPVVTAAGLVFIAASSDSKIRAFDAVSGRLRWEADLPAPGFATPAVYQVGGRQVLVIACGGGKLGKKSGDTYMAFALPGK